MSDWIQQNQSLLQWLGSLSLLMFLLSLIALALAIICLPQDYFVRDQRPSCHQRPVPPIAWAILIILKNVIGSLLILLGLILLLLPGQGLLTILIGVSMTNFPGKYRLERRLVSRPAIHKSLDKIRSLAKRPPLLIPE
ncbi:MAG: PGPGW domain-containing protein [Coraliomargarita sp.]